MNSKPLRLHVAMLNSLRSIEMLGGGSQTVSQIDGQYSRTIAVEQILTKSRFLRDHLQRFNEMFPVRWKAETKKEWVTVSQILQENEEDGCPDVFLKSITIEKPWIKFNEYTMKDQEISVPFIFHPHPFKPSVFSRLKGRMPSFRLYSRMKEIRKILSVELDDETKKRWRDILLINYPHESLSNQDIRHLWANETCGILLKESKGKFSFMEVDETEA